MLACQRSLIAHCLRKGGPYPVVLRNHELAVNWADAAQNPSLTPRAIADLGGNLTVKVNSEKYFMYAENSLPGKLPDAGLGSTTLFQSMPAKTFIDRCNGQRPVNLAHVELKIYPILFTHRHMVCQAFPYASRIWRGTVDVMRCDPKAVWLSRHALCTLYVGKIEDLPPAFRESCDAQAVESLVCDPIASQTPGASQAYASMWIGGPGSTTQAHYDVSHNLFTQLHGSKRFRLWGPQYHWDMHVFPDAHPRARKAQRSVDGKFGISNNNCTHEAHPTDAVSPNKINPETEIHPVGALEPPFLDVEIHPGDALFIPAFWFHHVEAAGTGCSLSINVFSESKSKLCAAAVFSAPIPSVLSGHDGDAVDMVQAFRCVCDTLCTALHSRADTPPSTLLQRVWENYTLTGQTLLEKLLRSRYTSAITNALDDSTDTLAHALHFEDHKNTFANHINHTHASPADGYSTVQEEPQSIDYSAFLMPAYRGDDNATTKHATDQSSVDALDTASIHHDLTPTLELLNNLVAACTNLHTDEVTLAQLDRTHARGTVEIVLCHLMELWAVQCVGVESVYTLLRESAAVTPNQRT